MRVRVWLTASLLGLASCGMVYGNVVPRRWHHAKDDGGSPRAIRASRHTYVDGIGEAHYGQLVVACRDGAAAMAIEYAHPLMEMRTGDRGMEARVELGVGKQPTAWDEAWGSIDQDEPRRVWLAPTTSWTQLESDAQLGTKARIPFKEKPALLSFHTKGITEVAAEVNAACDTGPPTPELTPELTSDRSPRTPPTSTRRARADTTPASLVSARARDFDAWPD